CSFAMTSVPSFISAGRPPSPSGATSGRSPGILALLPQSAATDAQPESPKDYVRKDEPGELQVVGTDEADGPVERSAKRPTEVCQDEKAAQSSNGSQGNHPRQGQGLDTGEEGRRWPRKDGKKHSRGAFGPPLKPLEPAAGGPRGRSELLAPSDPVASGPIQHQDGQKAAGESEGEQDAGIQLPGYQQHHA